MECGRIVNRTVTWPIVAPIRPVVPKRDVERETERQKGEGGVDKTRNIERPTEKGKDKRERQNDFNNAFLRVNE